MKDFIYGLTQYPDGVKACFVLLAAILVISGAAAIYISVKEYNEDHLKDEYWIRQKGRKKDE